MEYTTALVAAHNAGQWLTERVAMGWTLISVLPGSYEPRGYAVGSQQLREVYVVLARPDPTPVVLPAPPKRGKAPTDAVTMRGAAR